MIDIEQLSYPTNIPNAVVLNDVGAGILEIDTVGALLSFDSSYGVQGEIDWKRVSELYRGVRIAPELLAGSTLRWVASFVDIVGTLIWRS